MKIEFETLWKERLAVKNCKTSKNRLQNTTIELHVQLKGNRWKRHCLFKLDSLRPGLKAEKCFGGATK